MSQAWFPVLRAADAAARWHVNQRRKGAAQEPYVNHLLEVATLVAEATGGGPIPSSSLRRSCMIRSRFRRCRARCWRWPKPIVKLRLRPETSESCGCRSSP